MARSLHSEQPSATIGRRSRNAKSLLRPLLAARSACFCPTKGQRWKLLETGNLNVLPQHQTQLQLLWRLRRRQQRQLDLTATLETMSRLLEMAALVSRTSSSALVAPRLRGQRIQGESQGSLEEEESQGSLEE